MSTTPISDDPPDVPMDPDVSQEDIYQMWLDRAQIPPLYRSATWDNFECNFTALKKAKGGEKLAKKLERLKTWRGEEDATVFLTGDPGTGKTHLACATLARWIKAGKRGALFIVIGEFLADMKRGFTDGSSHGVMKRAQYSKLLVLDDVGSEMATDWVRDTLYMLINYRLNHQRPTIVTSNLRPSEIAESYHRRLASRLAGGFTIETSALRDYRLVKS